MVLRRVNMDELSNKWSEAEEGFASFNLGGLETGDLCW